MENLKKIRISAIIVALIIISCFPVATAAETLFSQANVDSNSFTFITDARKDTITSYATVIITNIYKADGSASNYQKVWVRAMYNGEETSVTKGASKDIPIASSFQSVGNYINMYAMGNNPSLDCKITGSWNAH